MGIDSHRDDRSRVPQPVSDDMRLDQSPSINDQKGVELITIEQLIQVESHHLTYVANRNFPSQCYLYYLFNLIYNSRDNHMILSRSHLYNH